jgi:hypothetical protein
MDDLAWGSVALLQDEYRITMQFNFVEIAPTIGLLLFGPLFMLALQFSRIDPHWYLRGED